MNDWAISRNRYWGTPIPLWRCSCGHDEMIGSIEELVEKSIEKIDKNIDLHRPYVDNVHIECPVCGKKMKRVSDVIDCWFDSGSMPFAQYHYPFENKELFESQFPADFISEGIDQTRGWFYSLLVISTFVMGKSPYKNVLVNDLLLDKYGQKMHKSKGNAIEPFSTIEKYGADPTRWYMLSVSPVWTPLKFDEEGIKEVQAKFFNTLKNTYTFFQMYANTDKVDPTKFKVKYSDLEEIDKWLISKYNNLVKSVTEAMEEYDLNKAVKYINLFVNEDLSNWYIRRNRRRFWGNELDNSKKAVYQTTYEILVGICKLIAPIAPFTSEEIYTNLTNNESVHLADYPEYNKKLVNEEIEEKMDLVRDLISLGRNAREEAKIKVRQPIAKVILDLKVEPIIRDLKTLIQEELNVKKIEFTDNLSEYMTFTIKPNFKICGPIFGSNMKKLSFELEKTNQDEIIKLKNGSSININIDNADYEITNDMVDIRINSKEGFNASNEKNNFIVLDTTLTDSLINEGIARELISKVQQLRKNREFDISDRIILYYSPNKEFENSIKDFDELIKNEILAKDIIEKNNCCESFDLNGIVVKIDIEKI